MNSISKNRFNLAYRLGAQMDDNAWLRRTSKLTDFSASGDTEAQTELQRSVQKRINERWLVVEQLQVKLADSAENTYDRYLAQEEIDNEVAHIQAIEANLSPADWDARVDYVTRQLQALPMNLRIEVLSKFQSEQFEPSAIDAHLRDEDSRSTRVQLRISQQEHQQLRILCGHSKRTMSELVRLAVLAYDPRFQLFKEMHGWESRYKLNSKLYVRLPAFMNDKLESQTLAHRSTTGATLRAMLRRYIAHAKLDSKEVLYSADWDEEEE